MTVSSVRRQSRRDKRQPGRLDRRGVERQGVERQGVERQGVERLEDRRLFAAAVGVSSSLLVYTAVQNTAAAAQTVTVTDTGDAPLNVTGVSLAATTTALGETTGATGVNRFSVANGPAFPAALQPGGTLTFQVGYTPTGKALDAASVQVATDVAGTADVEVRGIGATGTAGTGQPSLLRVLQAYDIPTAVGETDATNAIYPEPPAAGSQEVGLQRLAKAGAGPVTIRVLASYTSTGVVPYILGTYQAGYPSNQTELFHTLASEFQSVTVHPQGSTTFDPGSSSFGLYFTSGGRTGYTEDALNTYDTTDPRKFRFFPYETPAGTVVPDTYVMTTTEYYQPAGYDFTNLVAVIGNVKAAPAAPAGPLLSVTDPYAIPGSPNVAFNYVDHQNASVGDTVHDLDTLTLSNDGTAPLTVSGYAISSNWSLVTPPAFPLTIAAGGNTTLTVKFVATGEPYHTYNQTSTADYPNAGGVYAGHLTLYSNDAADPTHTIPFEGYYQYHSESNNEPSLQTITNLMFGLGTDIADTVPTPALTQGATAQPYGDEVVSSYWQAADATRPVVAEQIAAWHTQGATSQLGWYQQGSGTIHTLFTTGSDVGQTLFPAATNSNTAAAAGGSFTTAVPFGFRVNGQGTLSYSDDAKNPFPTQGGGHDVRFYPVVTAAGVVDPDAYLMVNDFGAASDQNYDFQDDVYLITNLRPVALPPTPADVYATATVAASADAVALTWAPATSATVTAYNVYRSATATGTYALLGTVTGGNTGYTDAAAPAGAVSYYRVTAVDSSSGTAVESEPANAVVSTVVGPVTAPATFSSTAGVAEGVNVLTVDSDASALLDPTTVQITTAPNHGGTATVSGTTGIVTYTPAARYTGTETLRYTVADANGVVSAPTTVTFVVNAAPATASPTPTATPVTTNADFFNAVSGQPVALAVLSNDTGDVDPTTVAVTVAPASGGTAVVNPATGTVTYTAPAGYTGTDTFTYTVRNTAGVTSDPATVSVAVSTTAAGPVANPDAAAATTAVPTVVDVLANDGDLSGSATLDPTTVKIAVQPNHGGTATVDPTTGAITYTSAAGFVGTETFSYTVGDDDEVTSQPAVVTVTVTAPPPAAGVPTTLPTTVTAVAGGATVIGVLTGATEAGTATIVPSTVAVSTQPTGGTVTVNADGTVSYTPNGTFVGTDAFAYTVADTAGTVSAPATVTVDVPLTIGSEAGDARSVTTAIDGRGEGVTLVLNRGSAQVFFTGSGTVATAKNGADAVVGVGLSVDRLVLTDTTAASTFAVRPNRIGSGDFTIGGVTDAAPLGRFLAPATTLTGTVTLAGLTQLQAAAVSGATLSVGTAGPAAGVTLSATTVADTTIASSVPVRSLRVKTWADATAGTSSLTAPSAGTIAAAGDFDPAVTVNGRLATLTVAGTLAGTLTAQTAGTVRVAGSISAATLAFTAGGTSLAHLVVGGAVAGSTVSSTGNVGSVAAGSLAGSTLSVGATAGTTVADATTAALGTATLGSLRLAARSADSAFAVLAGTIGSAALGTVDSSAAGVPFGLAADRVRSVTAVVDGKSTRLSAKQLVPPGVTFNDFEIKIA